MAFTSIFSFLFGCGAEARSKDEKKATKFDWYAVATVPRNYPMEIINGTFYYKGKDYGLDIPSGGTIEFDAQIRPLQFEKGLRRRFYYEG